MGKVIAFAIQKGGCAKTTTTWVVADCLTQLGKKVCVIDLDPQGNLSLACGTLVNENNPEELTTLEVMKNECNPFNAIVRSKCGFDIIPTDLRLFDAENVFSRNSGLGSQNTLKKAIAPLKDSYDYILIDCPPALGFLTINGLVAADHLVIPMEASYFSLYGFKQLTDTITAVKEYGNSNLNVLGILLVRFNPRNKLSTWILEGSQAASKHFNSKVFDVYIRESTKVKEAQGYAEPLSDYAPKSKPYQDYLAFTTQLIKEIE